MTITFLDLLVKRGPQVSVITAQTPKGTKWLLDNMYRITRGMDGKISVQLPDEFVEELIRTMTQDGVDCGQ